MKLGKRMRCRVTAINLFSCLFILPIHSAAQDHQAHSCTADAAGSFSIPQGPDGENFQDGWGFRGGGGFAISPIPTTRGSSYYIAAHYMYEQFQATPAALNAAKTANPTQLLTATSARGSFSAITIDPTVRFVLDRRLSLYGSGGFGWFHRGIGFHSANPASLLQSSALALDRLISDSGAFDVGGGINVGLKANGGLMLFVDERIYQGAAINSGTRLMPLSVGVRW